MQDPWSVVIPRVPLSLNKFLRMHWAKRKREVRRWAEEIWCASKGRLPSYKGRCQIRITVHVKRFQDPDNLIGSTKPILDALKDLGVIKDDNSCLVELEVSQQKETKPQTYIEVIPI